MFIHVALSCKIQNAVRVTIAMFVFTYVSTQIFFSLFPFLCVLYELQCLTSNKNIFHPKKKKKKKKKEIQIWESEKKKKKKKETLPERINNCVKMLSDGE